MTQKSLFGKVFYLPIEGMPAFGLVSVDYAVGIATFAYMTTGEVESCGTSGTTYYGLIAKGFKAVLPEGVGLCRTPIFTAYSSGLAMGDHFSGLVHVRTEQLEQFVHAAAEVPLAKNRRHWDTAYLWYVPRGRKSTSQGHEDASQKVSVQEECEMFNPAPKRNDAIIARAKSLGIKLTYGDVKDIMKMSVRLHRAIFHDIYSHDPSQKALHAIDLSVIAGLIWNERADISARGTVYGGVFFEGVRYAGRRSRHLIRNSWELYHDVRDCMASIGKRGHEESHNTRDYIAHSITSWYADFQRNYEIDPSSKPIQSDVQACKDIMAALLDDVRLTGYDPHYTDEEAKELRTLLTVAGWRWSLEKTN